MFTDDRSCLLFKHVHYFFCLLVYQNIFHLKFQEIVWRHKELQANVSSLQQQVTSAEEEKERLVRLRKHEMINKYQRNGHVNGVVSRFWLFQMFHCFY